MTLSQTMDSSMSRTKKILVVEDEAIAVMTIEDILKDWGYDVCSFASSGKSAIERAEENRPDIVIMDINLHGSLNGIDAAEKIKKICSADIIFVTGYVKEDYEEKASKIKPIAFLEKPINFSLLRESIERTEPQL